MIAHRELQYGRLHRIIADRCGPHVSDRLLASSLDPSGSGAFGMVASEGRLLEGHKTMFGIMSHEDRQLYYGDFEEAGEQRVRTNLALGAYQPQKASLAREWLDAIDRGHAARTRLESRVALWLSGIAILVSIVVPLLS